MNFLRSASDVAFLTYLVLCRYFFSMVWFIATFRLTFSMNPLISLASFGLFLRKATARLLPVRRVIVSCTVMSVKICFQKSAMNPSTTVAGMRPAFTISRMSSSSRFSEASCTSTGGLPRFSSAR